MRKKLCKITTLLLTLLVGLFTLSGSAAGVGKGVNLSDLLGGLDLSALTGGSSGEAAASADAGSYLSGLGTWMELLGISAREMKNCSVKAIPDQTYTGAKITPALTVTYNGERLKKGTDYTVTYSNNTKAGTAKATLRGKGNYTGSKTVSFRIVKKATSRKTGGQSTSTSRKAENQAKRFTVKLPENSYLYNGKARKPTVTVTVNGKTIPKANYTVTYKDNKNVGKATVTVKGKGTYRGYRGEKTFRINLKNISLSGLSSPGSGQLKAAWKKDNQADGYQLEYCTNKAFASGVKRIRVQESGTMSAVWDGLKSGKNYYVRLRSRKKVGSTYYYSEWSSPRSVKVK